MARATILNLRKSAPDAIANELRVEILTGVIPGGTQLKQHEIGARFGASIVPVREAFQRLGGEGLVLFEANKGVKVCVVSEEDFIDIADLRRLLEPRALQLSGPKLTNADQTQALAALTKASASNNLFERAELHWEFHRILYSKCERPRLLAQIANLHLGINRYLLPVWNAHGLSEHWSDSHKLIVEAVSRREIKQAMKLVIDQIDASSARVLGALRAQ